MTPMLLVALLSTLGLLLALVLDQVCYSRDSREAHARRALRHANPSRGGILK